jgi:hypothetical protein
MNFNLKHRILFTVAVIFTTGNAVVAADTQLRGGDSRVINWESDNKVVNWNNYEANQAKSGWGNNCPVPRQSTEGTSCRSFVPHPDNRPEAIFQCRYPNFYSGREVLYFQCTNSNSRDPRWTAFTRNK